MNYSQAQPTVKLLLDYIISFKEPERVLCLLYNWSLLTTALLAIRSHWPAVLVIAQASDTIDKPDALWKDPVFQSATFHQIKRLSINIHALQ